MTGYSESYIETAAIRYARRTGWLSFKWSSPAQRHVPDRIFIHNNVIIFIEFKATGGKPTKAQALMFDKLRRAGMDVYVIDSVEDAKHVLDSCRP